MNLKEALGFIKDAADVRQSQWAGAAECKDSIPDLVDELYEADQDECANMSNLIEDALYRVNNEGPFYGEETAMTAMAMWEWMLCEADRDEKEWWMCEGAVNTRATFLKYAHFLDEAWTFANNNFDYSDAFDIEFVPCYMTAVVCRGTLYEDLGRDQVHILNTMGIK